MKGTVEIQTPLEELTELEVHHLLESLNLNKYIEVFKQNEVDGRTLQNCRSEDDVKQLGITITAKARELLTEIEKRRALGLSVEHPNKRETIPSKPADDGDDKSSILSDKTKPLQYKRSAMGGDDDATTADVTDDTTVVTTAQSGDGNRDIVSIKPKEMDDKLIEDGDREVNDTDNNKMWERRSDTTHTLEYQIDLSSYFRLFDNSTVDESSQAPINIDGDVCEFTLEGSGLEDNEVKVFVSFRAAMKIYEHTHRQSAVLTIREIQIPSTTESKDTAGLMTSVLSFEPSGVIFSDDTMDGELSSSGDYITVSTPTLTTWDANWHLNAGDVSNALSVVSKENGDDDEWKVCQYGKSFNGIINISEKKAGTRIIATYHMKHFSLSALKIFKKLIGYDDNSPKQMYKQYYAVCALSKADCMLQEYKVQCGLCEEDPSLSKHLIDNYYIAVHRIYYVEDSKILPQQFLFTELEDLKVIGDTRVEVSEIVKTFSPDSNHNVGCYRQEVVSEHRFWRARIEFVNTTLWLSVPVVMELLSDGMTYVGTESMPVEIMVLQASGIVIETG